jgi:hypothetical protein
MKIRSLLSLLLTFFVFSAIFPPAARADATASGYYACLDFLRASPARQAKIAEGSGYSLEEVRWACRLLKRNGLARTRRLNREYAEAQSRRNQGGSSSRREEPRSCAGASWCSLSQHCVDRRCVDKQRRSCSSSGLYACTAGEKCVNGVCK